MNLTPPSSQHIHHHRHHQHKDNHNGSSISQYSTQISLGIKNLMRLSPPLNPTLPTTKPSNCIAINDHFEVINEKPTRSIISSNLPSTYTYDTSIDQSKLSHSSTNSKPNFLKFNCPKPTFSYSTDNKTYTGTKLSCSSVAYLHTPPPSVLCKSASYFSSSEDDEDDEDDDNDENSYDSDDYEEDDDEYGDEDYFNLKYQKLSSQTYQTF